LTKFSSLSLLRRARCASDLLLALLCLSVLGSVFVAFVRLSLSDCIAMVLRLFALRLWLIWRENSSAKDSYTSSLRVFLVRNLLKRCFSLRTCICSFMAHMRMLLRSYGTSPFSFFCCLGGASARAVGIIAALRFSSFLARTHCSRAFIAAFVRASFTRSLW